ncbi:SRPBCC domain-containing protein [Zhouia spongiae]|uniref:SRPBCC domain-containing protein n=1 Tax=Zhouia spongiae TaxID=2202721 RepID=A0ABY3YP73_9FLAO|nr:SRPBCC domain-containing protein [Zhouia spongiae]UNY99339.1 SRPBCC domain-containing protein [Zhouia spongiae]
MASIEHINYIKVPVGLVYQVLTTEEGLANVWTRKLKVKPQINFVNEFDFDDDYLTKMKIIELKKDSKIVWECLASDQEWVGTKVLFELTVKDNVTSVVLKHYNWSEVTEFYRWCNYNWAMFLLSLKNYCENKKGLPYQEREF